MSCGASTTMACFSPPNTRAASACTTVRSTPRSAHSEDTIFRCAIQRLFGKALPKPRATTAYNAGPGRAQAWRAATELEGAIFAETIPFNETRDYVKKVLANAMFYQAQLGLPYVSLKQRLGVVEPRGMAAAASLPAPDRS